MAEDGPSPQPENAEAGASEGPEGGYLKRRRLLGYRPDEVDAALNSANHTIGVLQQQLDETRRRLQQLEGGAPVAQAASSASQGGPPAAEPRVASVVSEARRVVWELEERAHERARELVVEAEADAARVRSRAQGEIEDERRMLKDLARIQHELVASIRGVMAEVSQALSQLEGRNPAVDAAIGVAPVEADAEEPPPIPEPVLPPLEPPMPPPADELVMDERFMLDAGPFGSLTAVADLESALAAMQGVEQVRLRRFREDRALIDVQLAGSGPIINEMRRVLPYPFEVEAAESDRLAVTVSAAHAGLD